MPLAQKIVFLLSETIIRLTYDEFFSPVDRTAVPVRTADGGVC